MMPLKLQSSTFICWRASPLSSDAPLALRATRIIAPGSTVKRLGESKLGKELHEVTVEDVKDQLGKFARLADNRLQSQLASAWAPPAAAQGARAQRRLAARALARCNARLTRVPLTMACLLESWFAHAQPWPSWEGLGRDWAAGALLTCGQCPLLGTGMHKDERTKHFPAMLHEQPWLSASQQSWRREPSASSLRQLLLACSLPACHSSCFTISACSCYIEK